jgi:maltase-glucoamylase
LEAAVNRTINAEIPLDVQYADIDHFDKRLDFTYDPVNFKGLPEFIDKFNARGFKFIIILVGLCFLFIPLLKYFFISKLCLKLYLKDPAIDGEAKNYPTFTRGKERDIYIKWPTSYNPQLNEINVNDNPYVVGYVWPDGKTLFPDFFKNRTQQWWIDEIKKHHNETLRFDGYVKYLFKLNSMIF